MIVEAQPPIEKITEPPPGHTFAGGFWVTHDFSGFVLADSVAPRLVECKNPGTVGARQQARTRPVRGELLILCAGLPTNTIGPLLPPWCRRWEVGGRRLHAKFGVLTFAAKDGGPGRCWRAFVTSANLTRGGLFRNLEVLVTEDTHDAQESSQGPSLAHELVHVFEALVASLPDAQRTKIDLCRLGLPVAARKLIRVHHTLETRRNLLASAFKGMRGHTCQIVSPPYGANDATGAARALAPYLKERANVHVVTGKTTRRRPRFSKAALDVLGEKHRQVKVWGVAEDGPDGRFLHAKLVAVENTKQVRVLVGSANFTESGLLGANRELCVHLDLKRDDFHDWDRELNWTHSEPAADAQEIAQDMPREAETSVTATFQCDPGQTGAQTVFKGQLILTWDQVPRAITYGDNALATAEMQPLDLQEALAELQITSADGREFPVPIHFEAPAGDPTFWTRKKPKFVDADEEVFLRWLGRRSQATETKEAPTRRRAVLDDHFAVPLKQPLVRLVRHREVVAELSAEERAHLLSRLVAQGLEAAELQVAEAILAASPPTHRTSAAPLLAALTAWMESEK